MHRILIAYEFSGVCIYSINKNRAIFTLALEPDKHFHMGRVLSIEWFNDTDVLVGFSRGLLQVYKGEGIVNAAKPIKIMDYAKQNLIGMRIETFKRAE